VNIVNAKGQPFTWSFSSMSEFEICPAQYAAKRFYCTHKDDGKAEHLIWGNRVHKALEERLINLRRLPEDMKEYDRYCRAMIESCKHHNIAAELQICIDREMNLTSWFGKQAWGRAVLDVCLDYGNIVKIFDWKTGKKKDNDLQIKIFCAFASLQYPEAEEFHAKYIWLNSGQTSGARYTRKDMPKIWDDIFSRVRTMEQAWKHEHFPERRCGLCRGWCINTDCPEWEPKR
jgi:hypothetical protein